MPVSYTHLDVYKRQLFQVGRLLLWAQGLMLGTIFYHLAPLSLIHI